MQLITDQTVVSDNDRHSQLSTDPNSGVRPNKNLNLDQLREQRSRIQRILSFNTDVSKINTESKVNTTDVSKSKQ